MKAAQKLRTRLARILCGCLMLAPTVAFAEEAPPAAHPALWRVAHGPATIYLFGSLHVLPTGYAWSTREIDAAKAASDMFIFEVPVDEAALKDEKQFIIENGTLGKGQSLRGVLTATEFQTYSAVLKRAGLKAQQFERYRPWLAAVVVGLAYLHADNLDSLRGADDDLMDYARAHGRPLAYLESVRDQMKLLISGDESDHIKALKSLIIGLPRSRAQESALLNGWASGDAEGFAARLESYFRGHADAQELLINARNRNWIPTIKDFLARPAGGTAMITVGAAHIGGPSGLIALLCREGYAVERMREGNAGESACGAES
jgi:uncharacterized protein YbaP (TraB family)